MHGIEPVSSDAAEQPRYAAMPPEAHPPKLAGTVTVGNQPSGLSFNPPGDLALVANSADKSISVLAVKGTDVKVIDTIDMSDIVSHVAFTPDGKHALAAKFTGPECEALEANVQKTKAQLRQAP